ncbi:MAG TPA: hypothetical protein IAC66_03530 [Candidatus Aphodousia gallistercoris]|nr:hypothetical protein [Candidatus Aphodousia gallistercoris]
MRISKKSIEFLKQFLRCIIYIGIGHTIFQLVSIVQTPEVAHLWYYALFVPGLYYLVPIIFLALLIHFAEKGQRK